MLSKDQLRQLLDDLPDQGTRSRLNSYRELVIEMRRRKYSYREISRLLAERCGFEISHAAVHQFVARHCREFLGEMHPPQPGGQPRISPRGRAAPEEPQVVRERIAAMKRRSHLPASDETAFRFDPAEPLRLEDEEA